VLAVYDTASKAIRFVKTDSTGLLVVGGVQLDSLVEVLTLMKYSPNTVFIDSVNTTAIPSTQAYGSWEFVHNITLSDNYFFISDAAYSSGYIVENSSNTNIILYELAGPTSLLSVSAVPGDKIKITRNVNGDFRLYVNGEFRGQVNDNSVTTSEVMEVSGGTVNNLTMIPYATYVEDLVKLINTLNSKFVSGTIIGDVNASQKGFWDVRNVTGTVSLPTGASKDSTLAASQQVIVDSLKKVIDELRLIKAIDFATDTNLEKVLDSLEVANNELKSIDDRLTTANAELTTIKNNTTVASTFTGNLNITVGTSAVQLSATTGAAKYIDITNLSTGGQVIYIGSSSGVTTANGNYALKEGDFVRIPIDNRTKIWAISNLASGDLRYSYGN
jgi:hypothetical protein